MVGYTTVRKSGQVPGRSWARLGSLVVHTFAATFRGPKFLTLHALDASPQELDG